ncbi:aldehyde ferredoxin oxidoreductase family protein [Thermodesulforhabdus norvegica]|uniref:Aldehyde:ferredoxin oxidoreductase n=1 Tax=Thermodesulforhabdus norvegica TaxID=39841 RepID=A0A1I4ULV7_9BACT|nr:aldehyde ferredoxin oxidoreductase family protein [Thermodesulforhabdus norvegica]SFM89962.1 aldehyde:ferredoxin oxidoreductase [Thermodesulforhabdus norvegica]
MKGFFKKYALIDLERKRWSSENLEDSMLKQTLGGKGLGVSLLLRRNPAGVDPFSPENQLVIALGPATDTLIWGNCRYGIYTRSPLTGFFGESYSGGRAAIPMSRTGFDAFVISGASDRPVWLEISDEKVIFHDAADLWGLDTYRAQDEIRKRLSGTDAGVIVIGPAGENLVRFAVVENDYWRSAGRCGMGAVLGSKKVKAIAFRGSQTRPVADPEGIRSYAREFLKSCRDHGVAQAYRNYGTPMMVALLNNAGGFPTRYWASGHYEKWRQISAEFMVERCRVRPRACRNCFMACGKLLEVLHGRHKGLVIEGPEYETIYSFGGLCMIDSIEEIAYLNDICDRLGLDTITAGNLVAFTIEASRRGKIGESIDYGDVDKIASLLEKIAYRKGIGDLLAEGIKIVASEWGLESLAVHVKGLEPAGYDPRALKGMGLAYAVSDRGACHLRSTFYKAELSGMIKPDQIEGKAELFIDFEDRCTLFDCMILCRFFRDLYPWEELARITELTTGESLTKKDLQNIASFVTDQCRWFNIREGLTAEDDTLPERLLKEKLEGGKSITREELERLKADYYRLRGWNPEGIPGRAMIS